MELRPLTTPPVLQAVPSQSEPARNSAGTAAAPPADRVSAASGATGAAGVGGKPSDEQLDKAIAHINKSLAQSDQGVEFSVDKDTHLTVVKVIDRETKAVLRQMPSEEALAIARHIDQTQGNLIRDEA